MSTDAGTPAAGDGRPPATRRRPGGLRDSALGRIGIFAALLLVALVVARTCGSPDRNVSQAEAVEIARDNAAFEPCEQQQCIQIRYVQRGIPVRAYWAVVLSDKLDDEGQPNRTQSFLIDVTTGDVSRP